MKLLELSFSCTFILKPVTNEVGTVFEMNIHMSSGLKMTARMIVWIVRYFLLVIQSCK